MFKGQLCANLDLARLFGGTFKDTWRDDLPATSLSLPSCQSRPLQGRRHDESTSGGPIELLRHATLANCHSGTRPAQCLLMFASIRQHLIELVQDFVNVGRQIFESTTNLLKLGPGSSNFGPKPTNIDQHLRGIRHKWPRIDQIWSDLCQHRHNFDQNWPRGDPITKVDSANIGANLIGQSLLGLGQVLTNMARKWPHLARIRPNLAPFRHSLGPPRQAKLGRHCPYLSSSVEITQN